MSDLYPRDPGFENVVMMSITLDLGVARTDGGAARSMALERRILGPLKSGASWKSAAMRRVCTFVLGNCSTAEAYKGK